jgi:uracil-DNA glycosylase family 4
VELDSSLQLQAAIRRYNKCYLRELGGKPVPGYGPLGASLFIVGEAPNERAEAQNIPFVGWTGEVLSRWLENLGLDRDKVYMTNAVKCSLRDNKGRLRTDGLGPRGKELQECRGWLAEELNLIKPKVVLLIGWAATQSVLRMPIYKAREYKTGYEAKDRRYFAIGHPGRRGVPLDKDSRVLLEQLRPFLST